MLEGRENEQIPVNCINSSKKSKRGINKIAGGFFFFFCVDADVVIEWRLRRWGPPGLSHKWTVCSKVKVFRPETPFSYNNNNNPSTETFCRSSPLRPMTLLHTKNCSLWKYTRINPLSLMYTFYSISIHNTERVSEWVRILLFYSVLWREGGGGWASKKETNLMFIFITTENIYSIEKKKPRERLRVFFFNEQQ